MYLTYFPCGVPNLPLLKSIIMLSPIIYIILIIFLTTLMIVNNIVFTNEYKLWKVVTSYIVFDASRVCMPAFMLIPSLNFLWWRPFGRVFWEACRGNNEFLFVATVGFSQLRLPNRQ